MRMSQSWLHAVFAQVPCRADVSTRAVVAAHSLKVFAEPATFPVSAHFELQSVVPHFRQPGDPEEQVNLTHL